MLHEWHAHFNILLTNDMLELLCGFLFAYKLSDDIDWIFVCACCESIILSCVWFIYGYVGRRFDLKLWDNFGCFWCLLKPYFAEKI